ncbi:Retrovirus-related Pol polyprotein from type-1 retrotransposable element R2 [Sesamum angolense]|uniref:Retrovirus-related Pol polyprotein from type-1 retrotransposable element R2 n=1 Tax=Sesamum angolense TaxID=2727404 RepID=A0AAE2BHD3_9LAMI|nr:Retrovirus-related Pol polyprotein from type-1 retrotransposable element R2 [Sesamum angolense]
MLMCFEFGKISCAIGLGLMIILALRGVFGWHRLVGILRRTLWTTLQSVAAGTDEPWLVLGDFNAVIDDSEVCGHAADTSASMNEFRQCILESGLIHLPFSGCPFTWHNCSTGSRSLWKRLDRMLVNEAWLDKWPNASYISALPSTSDHSPLIIHSEYRGTDRRPFRFDNFLTNRTGFLDSVKHTWLHKIPGTAMYEMVCKLKALKATFRQQRRELGNLADNVKRAKGFMDKAQELFTTYKEDYLLHLVKCCRLAKNFPDFYSIGVVLTDMNEVTEEFVSYFKTLLGGTRTRRDFNLDFLSSELKHCLTEDEADLLCAPITATEIKDAIFDIAEDSAPGPNGYTSAFFKAAWSVVGQEVSAAIGEFFISGKLLKQINATLLVLIPKVQMPSLVSDYRPISCCNVIYKAITKIMVKRMQKVLDLLIDYSQNAFIPGRSISDNILLAQELLAGYNQTRLPPRCTIKVDLQKAYDSVQWDFLLEGARGLRQGDPMSPYLFVLVMEIWSTLLRYRVQLISPQYK